MFVYEFMAGIVDQITGGIYVVPLLYMYILIILLLNMIYTLQVMMENHLILIRIEK